MLTDKQSKAAASRDKAYKLTDEKGLQLVIYPNGSKLWQMRYRIEGKEKTASLGKYPEVTLAEAREKQDQLRKQLANDIDPMQAKQAVREAKRLAQENSFEAVARAWYEGWSKVRSPRHAEYVIRRLEADVFPKIGKRPVSEIQPLELVAMVKAIEKRGAGLSGAILFNHFFRFVGGHAPNPPVIRSPFIRPLQSLPAAKR